MSIQGIPGVTTNQVLTDALLMRGNAGLQAVARYLVAGNLGSALREFEELLPVLGLSGLSDSAGARKATTPLGEPAAAADLASLQQALRGGDLAGARLALEEVASQWQVLARSIATETQARISTEADDHYTPSVPVASETELSPVAQSIIAAVQSEAMRSLPTDARWKTEERRQNASQSERRPPRLMTAAAVAWVALLAMVCVYLLLR